MRPNVLFITADQWRGDCAGYAGHPTVRTPHVDALAARGSAFLRHFGQAAPCAPARASLYTGLYQMRHRVCVNGTPLADRFDNIARAFRRAGYEPTLFGYTDTAPDPAARQPGDPALTSYEGVLPGFTVRVQLPEHELPWLSWLRGRGYAIGNDPDTVHRPAEGPPDPPSPAPPAYADGETQTAFLAGEFLRWLSEQSPGRPWFAHVSFLRPHPPFIVPAPWNIRFAATEGPAFAGSGDWQREAALHPFLAGAFDRLRKRHFRTGAPGLVRDWDEAALRAIRALYYGMIAEVDDQLGRVLAGLEAAGFAETTIIAVTSDHGEMMGDHRLLGKGGFFDPSYHLPLVLFDPRRPGGRRVEAFSQAIDLFPTLCDLAGISAPNHLDGRSLMPLLDGAVPADWRDAVHWEFDFREPADPGAQAALGLPLDRSNLAVVRTKGWKYVHFAGLPPLLFDLATDPAETRNLADEPGYRAVRLEMAERLLTWRAEHLDRTLSGVALTRSGPVDARA